MDHKRNQKGKLFQIPFRRSVSAVLILFVSLILNPFATYAQDNGSLITIKGNVVDELNSPVIGASIFVTGTKTGTITDVNGNFSLKANSNAVLTVSYIGYVSQKVNAFDNIRIKLKEDVAKLDEVVVVGYGQVKRANLTGAVTSMSMKEVQDFPAPNLATVIRGQMPGVHISESTGNPIGITTLKVRINGSFSGSTDPLFVIDGFIRDIYAFNLLDPSEVESISVLKDASASVYGVRGRDGVVLVSTKKGKAGKPKVNYSASFGTNQGVKMPDMMSAYEQGKALNDLWQQEITYKHVDPATRNLFSEDELTKLKTLNYNWLEQAWQNSNNQRHTLNVSGGTDDVRYFIGGSFMDANGNFQDLKMNRYGIRFGVEANITKNLKGNFAMDYGQRDTQSPLNNIDTEYDRMYGTFSELTRTSRFLPAYINGLPANTSGVVNSLEMFNSGSYRRSTSTDLSTQMALEYSVPGITGLKVSLTGNYAKTSGYGKQYAVPYYLYNFIKDPVFPHLYSTNQVPVTSSTYRSTVANGDKLYESADFGYTYQINPQISYANKFGKHDLNAIVLYEQSETGGNNLNEYRQTMLIPNYEVMAGFSSVSQNTASSIRSLARRQSVISRVNYNYDEKYFIETATRLDASSLFAEGYRWGAFPTVSAAWRISAEPFFEDILPVVDNLKIRSSFGRMGSDDATRNQYRYSYITDGSTLMGGGVLSTNLKPQNEGMSYLTSTWEKTDQFNFGLDVSVLHDLSFAFDGFYKHTFDILDLPTSEFPQSSGIIGVIPRLNYGIQDAWGGEIELKYNKKLSSDLSFQVKGNFAYAMNKVIKKYQNPGVIGTWADENGKVRGGEVGFKCMGLARTQEDIDNYIAYLKTNYEAYHGTTGTVQAFSVAEENMKPGMLMYEDAGSASYQDANGNWHDGAPDGIINDNDQRIISKYSFNPYNYGLTIGFTWKSFKVDAMFTGAFGSNVIFEKGFWTNASGGGRTGAFLSETSNQLREWYGNYWTENNVNAKYPRLDDYSNRQYRSTFWMRDGHELQLRTINLSYILPQQFIKSLGVEQCRVYCQGSNIWTIINPYPYKDASVGFWSDYPMVTTINFGLNLSF